MLPIHLRPEASANDGEVARPLAELLSLPALATGKRRATGAPLATQAPGRGSVT